MVSGYAQKFKMAKPSDNPCSSEDDEYSDPLEVAASAGAKLSTPEKASISRKRKEQTNVLFEYNHVVIVIESQYRESDFYDLG